MVIEAVAEDENLKIDVFSARHVVKPQRFCHDTPHPDIKLPSPAAEKSWHALFIRYRCGSGVIFFAPHERRDHRSSTSTQRIAQ